ncbi:MAG TPA: undecaprenyldiphospho-muramoylpentapeptide beta-N-acetylglucosaminyltransferase [Terriglobales bacterium]|nr:undecaprenyldiphospho-muramoylpentapeptide beta-N-acetylglucosaminyltransferase [Terriglobales bacterium]
MAGAPSPANSRRGKLDTSIVNVSEALSARLTVYSHLMRAILAGGGTGGHVIPALAIAQELRSQFSAEVLFIGTSRGIENRLVPNAGFALRLVNVGALKNVGLATRVKTLFDLPRATWAASRILSEFRPDFVMGVGGYASGPAMLAAVLHRIPTLVFEPNLVPGFANRVVARFVSAAAVHFEETGRYFRHCTVTGVPVREAFFKITGEHATPTLLVFGGSQGAHAINQAAVQAAAELLQRIPQLRIVHQTGEADYNVAKAAYEKLAASVEVYRFIDDMPGYFARASLLICRSGASTVAEITAAGKPAIFVPFPRAADDHQKRNAEALQKAGAAVMLEQSQLTPESLISVVTSLFSDQAQLKAMGEAVRKLSHPNAAREIASMAARLAGVHV